MKRQTFLVFLSLALLTAGVDAALPRRVLILHSFGRDFPPFDAVAEAFRMELGRQSRDALEFYDASLEMARFDGEQNEEPLVAFLEALNRAQEPDLVAVVGAPALFFCQRNLARLFPTAPLLVMGADKRRVPDLAENPRFVAVEMDLELPLLASSIRQVLPELKHLFVVMGVAPLEQFWEQELRREWPQILPGVEFHWMSQYSLDAIKRELRAVPSDSAIFYGILSRDADGVPHEHQSALSLIRAAAGAPVFGFSKEQLGHGIIGGPLVEMRRLGVEAASVASRILGGEKPADIRVPAIRLQPPEYDWRELQEWGIPNSRVPAGAIMAFRPPSLWETHRNLVLGTGGVLGVQTLLILLLGAARRRARQSEAGLRLTAEAAKVGLWEQGRDEQIEASPQWRSMMGLPARGPIRTEDVLERIHPEDLHAVKQCIDQARREGRSYELEHRVVLQGGAVRWSASRGRSEEEAVGQRVRMLGVSMDITERKESEAQMARQHEELAHLHRVNSLGELSGTLAHELNQPLGSILSNAQAALRLLSHEPPNLGLVQEILEDIVNEDRRAGGVIERLRNLLKRGETRFVALSVAQALDDVVELLNAELTARGVRVVREVEPGLPPVLADGVQLQQILINLIANACDAMDASPPGGRQLTLCAGMDSGWLHLQVRDTGPGLRESPEQWFEPFYTTKAKGLGIGLPICKTIVEAHHGALWAETCETGGAVFHFTLPVAPSA